MISARRGRATGQRLAAVAGLVVLVALAIAPPASARPPSITLSSPGNEQTLTDPTPTIAGQVTMQNGTIEDVTVSVISEAGHPVPQPYRLAGEDRSSIPFTWTPALTWNGKYSAVVRATGVDRPVDTNGAEPAQLSRQFSIEAPPARPRGVKALVEEGTRFVKVSWTDNSEPDLLGYQVQRAVGESDDWAVSGESTSNSFEDRRTAERGGTFRYRVVAVRQGASSASGVVSDPSAPSTADVPAPPASTTTTASPNNPGDGGGGGGGDGTTTSTVPGDSPDPTTPPSGGGGGSNGSTGGSGGGTSTAPVIRKSGKVDLSGFSILDQTKAPPVQSTDAPDAGFDENLPFGDQPAVDEEGGDEQASGPTGFLSDNSADRRVMLTFLAAGLLATVLLMHVLWIKGEVDRLPLEPLPPAGPKLPGRLKAPGR